MNKQNDVGGVDVSAVMTEIEKFGRAYCSYVRGGKHEDLEEATRIYDGIPALLASPAGQVGDGWMPIETAPKNAVPVLVCLNNGMGSMEIARRYPIGWVPNNGGYPVNATHWQPLPSPPAIASQEVGND